MKQETIYFGATLSQLTISLHFLIPRQIYSFREKTELLYYNTFIDFGWISVGKKKMVTILYCSICKPVKRYSLNHLSLQHETMKLSTFSMVPDIKIIILIKKKTAKTFIPTGCEINFHAFDYFYECTNVPVLYTVGF